MRRYFLLILLTWFSIKITPSIIAQGTDDFMDLLIMYVDEEYDKCFIKAIKYTEKDKTKKHPLPYLYASMASYEMSQDNQYTNMYPKAYKTAISYLTKYRKKDKGYEYREDSEDYIERIKFIIAEEIENYILEASDNSYSKAAGLAKKVCYMDPMDYGSKLLYAHLCYMSRNKSAGKEYLGISMEYIEALPENKFAFKNMTKSQQFYLKYSLIEYAGFKKVKDSRTAKEIIQLGEPYFYKDRDDCLLDDNEDFRILYDEIQSL